jgi:hypothetical protein
VGEGGGGGWWEGGEAWWEEVTLRNTRRVRPCVTLYLAIIIFTNSS